MKLSFSIQNLLNVNDCGGFDVMQSSSLDILNSSVSSNNTSSSPQEQHQQTDTTNTDISCIEKANIDADQHQKQSMSVTNGRLLLCNAETAVKKEEKRES